MPEYQVTFKATVQYTARNEQQAQERANQIGEWLQTELVLPDKRNRPWLGALESEQDDFEQI